MITANVSHVDKIMDYLDAWIDRLLDPEHTRTDFLTGIPSQETPSECLQSVFIVMETRSEAIRLDQDTSTYARNHKGIPGTSHIGDARMSCSFP